MLSVILPYKARTFLIHGLSALCTRLLGLLGFLLYTLRPVPVKRRSRVGTGPVPGLSFLFCPVATNQPRFCCPARERSTTARALGIDIGGRSVTIEGVMFFSENHRQACLLKGMIK